MTPEPQHCPKYHTCCAAVCPLDATKAVHLPGEKVCYYLNASGKAGADERFENDPVFAACIAKLPIVCARHPDIRRRVERAAETGFRKNNLRHRADAA